MHVHVFIHAKHLTLNAQRQKEWRETKKEQPRRISEEGVRLGECIQEKAQKKLNSMQNIEMPLIDGQKAREYIMITK